MKKIIYSIVLSLLVLYILFFPDAAIQAASFGLVLWYTKMLPTLLPFAILSHIFVETGLLSRASRFYPLIAGFLFGFPLGSRITAQLVTQGEMSHEEGSRIFAICNNISPIFIRGFILSTSLKRPELTGITLAILYLPPLLYYILTAHTAHRENLPAIPQKKSAPRSQINFKIIDAGIMSGFETMAKLGGYIMLFAILARMATSLPIQNPMLGSLIVGITEITNGVACICAAPLPFGTKYLLVIFCTALGGLSGIAQTASMVREAGLSMGKYIKTKLICSLISLILAILYLWLIH